MRWGGSGSATGPSTWPIVYNPLMFHAHVCAEWELIYLSDGFWGPGDALPSPVCPSTLQQLGRLRVIVWKQIIAPNSEQLLHNTAPPPAPSAAERGPYARSLRFSLDDFLTAPFLLSSFSTLSLWSSTFIMVSRASVTWSITSLQRCMLPWGRVHKTPWSKLTGWWLNDVLSDYIFYKQPKFRHLKWS